MDKTITVAFKYLCTSNILCIFDVVLVVDDTVVLVFGVGVVVVGSSELIIILILILVHRIYGISVIPFGPVGP